MLNWITSLVEEVDDDPIISPDNLKNKIWSLHPWLLTQISLMHRPFFEIYSQVLILCTRQGQQYTSGNFSKEMIQPKLFYQLSNFTNEVVSRCYKNFPVNKNNHQILEGLLVHWDLLLTIDNDDGNNNSNNNNTIQQEWIALKNEYENCVNNKQTPGSMLFTQM